MDQMEKQIGSRIRMFRRLRGLSVEQLGGAIGKSKATVYKYESGLIPIGVDTLLDIAGALKVAPAHFFDTPSTTAKNSPKVGLFDKGRLYAYYFDGRIKQIVRSLLTFYPDAEEEMGYRASFYMHLNDFSKPEQSRYIYSGTLISHELVSYFILENIMLPIETFVMEILHPLQTSLNTWGLFLGISDQPLTPMTTKILFSKVPLSQQELQTYPLMFTKDELKNIREKNAILLSIRE